MTVWPRPVRIDLGTDTIWLSHDLQLAYSTVCGKPLEEVFNSRWHCYNSEHVYPKTAPNSAEGRIKYVGIAFEIFRKQIETQSFVPWKLHPKRGLQEPNGESRSLRRLHTVTVNDYGGSRETGFHSKVSFEAYHLQISQDGQCNISLSSPLGANAAFATLLQLFYAHSAHPKERYCSIVPLTIRDEPHFVHRGLHVDISRNVILPADIKGTIDGMWLNKMSRLRIHATDSQSWPLDIPSIPELAQKGAYHIGHIWSSEALKEIQQYGYDRGIEVYLEIDMPGHTGSIFHSFPDVILAYNLQPWDKYAAEPPAGQLRLNNHKARDLVTRIFNDVLPRVAPFNNVFNIGGDELNTNCYSLEEGIESNSKDIIRPFLQRFYDNILPLLQKHNLNPILWEEVLLEWNLDFPANTIFQTWKVDESISGSINASVKGVVERGYRAIFGPCSEWYLDLGFGMWVDEDPNNPKSAHKYPYSDWCPPYKNWKRVYTYDPYEGIDEKYHAQIIGGEMHMWCELTDAVNLESRLWPRVAAGAEVLWSGPGPATETVTRRLAEMRERLVLMGIQANVVQMLWCLQNPGSSLI